MPTYEFRRRNCEKLFEWISSISEHERKQKEGMPCPGCASRNVERQISSFQVKTSKKSWASYQRSSIGQGAVHSSRQKR